MADTRLTALVQALEGIADTPDYYTETGINQLSDVRDATLFARTLSY
jgi:hypothetical protein